MSDPTPTPLTFDALRSANSNRRASISHGGNTWTLGDWACALAGEVGEACNIIKKIRRGDFEPHPDGYGDGYDDAKVALAKELADVITYCDLLAEVLHIDLGEAVRSKFNEVSVRRSLPHRL